MATVPTIEGRRGSARTIAIAYGSCGLALAGSMTTLALALASRATIRNPDAADPVSIVMPITFALVGLLVATRHPRNATGWLMLFIAVDMGLVGVADQYARLALITAPGPLPGASWALVVEQMVVPLVYPCGSAALLLMLLPSGHLPSRRWRPVAALAVAITAVTSIPFGALGATPLTVTGTAQPMVPNPIAVPGLESLAAGPIGTIPWLLGLVVLIVAALAPFIRMRRAGGDERQQLKWIAYAVLVSAVVSSAIEFSPFSGAQAAFSISIVLGFGVAFPVAIGFAILRHHLYDIDIVVSRTLVYGSLAVFITAVYVGIAVGIGTLVGSGGKPNLALSILATAIVAVGFQPVRERVQKVANRLVYGKRATPYEVLSQFSSRVAESYAAEEVLARMARVLQEGTGAEAATVWLRSGQELRPAATHPEAANGHAPQAMTDGMLPELPGATRVVAVRHQDEILGALSIIKRRGESLTPLELKLLDDLAHQAGLVLKNVGLTADLQARLEELRLSRQRLVSAQDEERRRLERNLHDGAQQHLVALKVKLGLVEILLARDPDKAKATLTQLKGDADEALDTLRDLARGIYPPLLADKGLPAALSSQARKVTLPVVVDAEDIGRYPQEVEATVYFCCLEALQNVQKYAGASQVTVRLREANGELRFEVTDDGRGFDPDTVKRGAGLTNMQDRLDSLGGCVTLTSQPGHGTSLRGTLPITSALETPRAAGAVLAGAVA
jgi:signal transduction histidine kinase